MVAGAGDRGAQMDPGVVHAIERITAGTRMIVWTGGATDLELGIGDSGATHLAIIDAPSGGYDEVGNAALDPSRARSPRPYASCEGARDAADRQGRP